MADHDRFEEELRSLSLLAEERAGDGWSAERVRRMGGQRRRRRTVITVVAASVAAVTLGGGVIFSAAMRNGTTQPAPVQTPTATATDLPTRPPTTAPTTAPSTTNEPAPPALGTGNLLRTSDIKTYTSDQQVLITDPGLGRSPDTSWVCLPEGLKPLDAQEILSRNFRISVPGESKRPSAEDPLAQQPSIYTEALQFADADAAQQAYETFDGWVKDCGTALRNRGYTALGEPKGSAWIAVKTGVSGTKGRFHELTYRTPSDDPNSGWFEAIGLTRAGDRLMITVSLTYGQDKNVGYEQFPQEPDLVMPHEQFGLIVAAAKRLTK